MSIKLPDLPYDLDALEPYISKETLRYHYGKHHTHYVDTLNKLIRKTQYASMNLSEILLESCRRSVTDEKIFNNAAQAWNHEFFWNCMSPNGDNQPSFEFTRILERSFGSIKDFQAAFMKAAVDIFGSGWAWLIKNHEDELSIVAMENGRNPFVEGKAPLLTCDVWEHAYYLDYQNERERYVESFWKIINWDFVESNFRSRTGSLYKTKQLEGIEVRPPLY